MLSLLAVTLPVLLAGLVLWTSRAAWGLALARSVALGAAAVVVVADLLPAAFEALGVAALAVAAASFGVVWWAEDRAHARGAGLAGATAAVAVHQVVHSGEVVVLADVLGPAGMVAMGAHALPLVAVALLGVASRGQRAALGAWAGLLAASLVGAWAGSLVPHELVHEGEPWLQASLVGVLLHVLMHVDVGAPARRSADLVGWLGGGGAVWWLLGGMPEAEPALSSARLTFADALVEVTAEAAPMLLLGLLLAAAVQGLAWHLPEGWLATRSRVVRAFRGAVLAAPLPLCACGVLPLARSLSQRSAAPALVTAFVLATPELGLETLLVSARFLGWPLALLRLGGVVVGATAAGVVVGALVGAASDGASHLHQEPPRGSFLGRAAHALDELLLHMGPFVAAGLAIAALAEGFVDSVPPQPVGQEVFAATLVAVPALASGAGAMPLAGVLWAKGMSAAAVVAALVVGPSTNLAAVGFLQARFGSLAAGAAVAALLVTSWGVALCVWGLGLEPALRVSAASSHGHGAAAWAGAAVLGGALLGSLVHHGSAAWLGQLGGGAGHEEGHAHHHVEACDHEHAPV